MSTATIDYNGYFPDGQFEFGYSAGAGGVSYTSLAAVTAAGKFEAHGEIVGSGVFAGGTTGPADFATTQQPILPVSPPRRLRSTRAWCCRTSTMASREPHRISARSNRAAMFRSMARACWRG